MEHETTQSLHSETPDFISPEQRRTEGGMRVIYNRKNGKIGLTIDAAEYVANVINGSMWLCTCNSAVYFMGMLYRLPVQRHFSYWYHRL